MKAALSLLLSASILASPALAATRSSLLTDLPSALGNMLSRSWVEKVANPLPQGLTAEEKAYLLHNFDEYLRTKAANVDQNAVPYEGLLAPAEFERNDGVIFAWQGYTSLLTQLITFVAETDIAWVVVDRESDIDYARRTLVNAGANEANLRFLTVYLDSVWIRDYGPWFSYTPDGGRVIIDLNYNRPRPNDDKFPSALANHVGIPAVRTDLILPGGNLILDGHGVAIMTDVTFDPSQGGNPNLTVPQLEKYMKEHFGCTKVIILEDMNRDGTGHVDMFSKLLNDTTFIVGEYKNASEGAPGNYDILNRNAARLANETNGKGEKFKVVRIPMPRREYSTTFSYTNSLIANHKVLVPVYNKPDEEEALNVYRSVLPGYDVKGFDCSGIISANGAIHCITKLMMSDPVEVAHEAPAGLTAGEATVLTCTVDSADLPEKVELSFAVDGGAFQTVACASGDKPGVYTVELPAVAAGSSVQYFFRAVVERGIFDTFPKGALASTYVTLTAGGTN